ncbi:phosphonate metabolism protein/1,5-bisphosphokinase (PRPP-forming) PhnN [Phreatobacter sp.]|uniref:phosphonate metabolism protein/1,5-bisphosphokinase (PRPP-forming) PhnN n=1 Tax=Phreatobacter sp. TaxID=1966341 RepID=UPI003F719A58
MESPDKTERAGSTRPVIGPGRLVLVVGPSGAGKDTVIRAARSRLGHDEAYLFPRRVVTRPPSAAEDNIEADPDTFARMEEAGGFALVWSAHGHRYGIPAVIDHAVYEGRTVVCNVSRQVIDLARRRYEHLTVVEITAPADILAARIAARGRSSDSASADRLDRRPAGSVEADVTVVNDGEPEEAVMRFLAILAGPARPASGAVAPGRSDRRPL